jgi:hypothetical protein
MLGEPISLARQEMQNREESEEKPGSDVWTLPKLSEHSIVLGNDDKSEYWSAIADGRSKLGRLARYLAGRLVSVFDSSQFNVLPCSWL